MVKLALITWYSIFISCRRQSPSVFLLDIRIMCVHLFMIKSSYNRIHVSSFQIENRPWLFDDVDTMYARHRGNRLTKRRSRDRQQNTAA